MLGFTQATWDNLSGKEEQPESTDKSWSKLTDTEKAGARLLGYTKKTKLELIETYPT